MYSYSERALFHQTHLCYQVMVMVVVGGGGGGGGKGKGRSEITNLTSKHNYWYIVSFQPD